MKILIYDTETNSLDTNMGFVKELAWAVYDSETWRCLFAKSALIRWPTSYEDAPDAITVNGLSKEFCDKFGRSPDSVFIEFLVDVVEQADVLCGHNAVAYDRPMIRSNIKRSMLFDVAVDHPFNTLPHIDTLFDCPYPPSMKAMGLKYLAYDHGVILSDAHQALADVFACKGILAKYPLANIMEVAATKLVSVTAKIDFNNTQARDRIKQARFYWNPARKLWEKRIREFYLPGIQLDLPGLQLGTTDL